MTPHPTLLLPAQGWRPRQLFVSRVAYGLIMQVLAATVVLAQGSPGQDAEAVGEAAATELKRQLGVMLQVDNLLDAYREENRYQDFARQVEQQFRLVQEAGVRWVRAGILWNQIESKQGHFDWEAVEAVLRAARQHQVQLVWLVGGTPLWNSQGGLEGLPKQLPDPHFRRFLRHLLRRYGGRKEPEQPLKGSIHYWEILNEPNYHWQPAQYAILLTEAHEVLSADDQARIVFGGLGGDVLGRSEDIIEGNQVLYFEKVVRALPAGKRPFYCANFHLYGHSADRFFPKDDNAVDHYLQCCQDKIRQVLKRTNLEELPVWCTEFDYPSAIKHQIPGPYQGRSKEDGRKRQARFLEDWLPKLLADQPQRKVFWASLVDSYNDDGAFLSTGLCRWKSARDRHGVGERKPVYYALQKLLQAQPR